MNVVRSTTGRSTPERGTRERLIDAMAAALQRRGLHGVGLNELLDRAQAPKGVLYHHFPGGKTELAIAAIEAATGFVTSSMDDVLASGADPVDALGAWLSDIEATLARSSFERGCPLATVALETGADDVALRSALAAAFSTVRERLTAVMVGAGVAADRADALAALIVATYEGSLMQARVAGSAAPMRLACSALLDLLRTEIPSRKGPR